MKIRLKELLFEWEPEPQKGVIALALLAGLVIAYAGREDVMLLLREVIK